MLFFLWLALKNLNFYISKECHNLQKAEQTPVG